MTIIVGLKHNGNVWIGSDSLITDDDTIIDPSNLANSNKLISVKNGFIGCAGDVSARNLLELFFESPEMHEAEFEKLTDVLKFVISFRKFVRESIHPHSDLTSPDTGMPLGLDLDMLLATRSKLFSIDSDGAILEYNNFFCIGRGGEMGLGVIDYIYNNQSLSPEEKIKEACRVVSKYHHSCGGPTVVKNVTQAIKVLKKKIGQ